MSVSIKVDDKGRITIPKEFRKRFALEPGKEVDVEIRDDEILVHPKVSREEFKEKMKGCIDEETAESPPMEPEELKKDWTSDLPS